MAEAISKPDFSANKEPTVELKKVSLIGSAYNVVVVEYRLWRANAVQECAPEISGICATSKNEHRLL